MTVTRLSWDDYFMETAELASVRSPCERLQVGCVIVKDNRLISMGYNGFLAGTEHRSIVRDGHEQATIHAEMNAVTDAAKRGVSIDGSVAYITHYPCINCYKALASSGVQKIYYRNDYRNDPVIDELGYNIILTHINATS
jgi:dCMP deaminase